MSNIEPTEEQKQAAASLFKFQTSDVDVDDLARFLAEREAKLRGEHSGMVDKIAQQHKELCDQECELARRGNKVLELRAAVDAQQRLREALVASWTTENDTLRARVAGLEAKIADAVFSCPGCGRHDFGFFASQIKAACGPCRTRAEAAEAREAQHLADIKALRPVFERVKDAESENDELRAEAKTLRAVDERKSRMLYDRDVVIDTLRARVAELEAVTDEISDMRAQLHIADTREAQHLADIKALHRQLDLSDDVVREAVEGYVALLRENGSVLDATAHYDEMDAPASTEGGEG